MARRRSASSTTRMLQGLFALIWIGFMIYMISGYLKKHEDKEVAAGDNGETIETVDDQNTSTPPPINLTPSTNETETSSSTLSPNANLTAKAILDNVITAYRNAPAYSDRGQLKQEYTLQGRRIDEVYPWNTRWSSDGRLETNIFDVQIRSNGNLLSCFVSDIRKENLQNQQLFLRGTNLIQQLYRDSVASYYLNGGERIPVNDKVVPNGTLLTPSPIALLTGESQSPWLSRSVQPTKLGEDMVEGQKCFVIQCPSESYGKLVAWVDKKSYLVRKIKLPTSLLHPMFAADPAVRDINFFAEFKDASFTDGSVAFEKVGPRKDVWPVREFVVPADPLPTNLLGEFAPEFSLVNEQRERITDRQIMGKPVAMLFLDGSDKDSEMIRRFENVRKNSANTGFEFAVVAGPGSIETLPTGSWRLSSALQPDKNKSKLVFLADLQGETAKSMELADLPAVVVMDSKLNIQYADLLVKPAGHNGELAVNNKWDSRLVLAMSATAKGLNVANDMRAEYRSHLDKYFSERDARLVNYFPGYSLPGKQKIAAVPAKVRREQTAERSNLKLNPRLVWESKHLKQPGNVAIVPDSDRRPKGLLILDGWQTVSLFSVDGKPVNRKRLTLPEGVAVTTIRPLVSATGEQRFAMFSVGGRQLHLFDGSMEPVESFPKDSAARNEILACEVLPGSRGKSDQLLVCFGGSGGAMMFDTFTGQAKSIGNSTVRALALSGRAVIAADDRSGALLSMDNGRTIDDRREYTHVKSGASGASVFAATSMTVNGEWSLVLLDSDLKIKRTFPISSAVFKNGLEPITGVATADGKGTWAVADSGNRIYLLSDEGIWLGDMATDGNVSGAKLLTIDGRTRLVVSTDKKIECWELNFAPERIGATRQQRN